MIQKFHKFVDKKDREALEHLKIIKKVLEKHHMEVSDHLDGEEPYLFVKDSDRNCSFDGVRLYVIGDDVAFHIQKEADTHPFGKAYGLDVEGMYFDLISDKMDEDKAGVAVARVLLRKSRPSLRRVPRRSVTFERQRWMVRATQWAGFSSRVLGMTIHQWLRLVLNFVDCLTALL